MDLSGNLTPESIAERADLETPHQCTAEIEAPDVGAPLDELEAYVEEFRKLIEEMFAKLPGETRILEGMTIPTYEELCEETQNGLSETNENTDNGQCTGNVDSQSSPLYSSTHPC